MNVWFPVNTRSILHESTPRYAMHLLYSHDFTRATPGNPRYLTLKCRHVFFPCDRCSPNGCCPTSAKKVVSPPARHCNGVHISVVSCSTSPALVRTYKESSNISTSVVFSTPRPVFYFPRPPSSSCYRVAVYPG